MAGGGARAGAGRPKGSKNKKHAAFHKAVAGGITPLDFLLKVMRDAQNLLEVRIDAAKAAAPYVHSKLSTIELTGDLKVDYAVTSEPLSEEQWQKTYGQNQHPAQH